MWKRKTPDSEAAPKSESQSRSEAAAAVEETAALFSGANMSDVDFKATLDGFESVLTKEEKDITDALSEAKSDASRYGKYFRERTRLGWITLKFVVSALTYTLTLVCMSMFFGYEAYALTPLFYGAFWSIAFALIAFLLFLLFQEISNNSLRKFRATLEHLSRTISGIGFNWDRDLQILKNKLISDRLGQISEVLLSAAAAILVWVRAKRIYEISSSVSNTSTASPNDSFSRASDWIHDRSHSQSYTYTELDLLRLSYFVFGVLCGVALTFIALNPIIVIAPMYIIATVAYGHIGIDLSFAGFDCWLCQVVFAETLGSAFLAYFWSLPFLGKPTRINRERIGGELVTALSSNLIRHPDEVRQTIEDALKSYGVRIEEVFERLAPRRN